MNFFSYIKRLPIALAGTLVLSQGHAMVALEEEEMSGVSGAGLALALEDFRFQMAPTSYIEQVGSAPGSGTSFNRGDLRWFGLAVTDDTGAATTWTTAGGHNCSNGLNAMGCPIGVGGVGNYAGHNNPFVLRVFDYSRVGSTNMGATWVPNINATVLELLGPSNMDRFRWSFWGEIEASKGGVVNPPGSAGILQSQSIIRGKPSAATTPGGTDVQGPLLQMFQYQGDESFGLLYHSRLSGDYRLSVNQIAAGPDINGVPRFTSEEGLYFTNVNAYLPLGQLHYQAITLGSTPSQDGNFVIELARVPNDVDAFGDLYSVAGANGYQRTARSQRYYETHGYVRWGNAFPTCAGGNCLSGTGVSAQRFSGAGFSRPATMTLPALAINSTNFSGDLCTNAIGQWRGCSSWSTSQTAQAVTVNLPGVNVGPTGTREQVIAAGGIAFVARSGGSWTVANNQNAPVVGASASVATLQNDLAVKRARTNAASCNIFGASCDRLDARNPPDTTTIQNRANTLFAVPGNFNPLLSVDAINLGTARVEGLLVQRLTITSLGAANL